MLAAYFFSLFFKENISSPYCCDHKVIFKDLSITYLVLRFYILIFLLHTLWATFKLFIAAIIKINKILFADYCKFLAHVNRLHAYNGILVINTALIMFFFKSKICFCRFMQLNMVLFY